LTRYLLDTNILSHLVRNPQGRVATRIAEVGADAICTSIIVAAELRFGAAKKASARLTTQLERILSAIDIQPFESPADAAYALATDCAIVTDNAREFRRISGLKVENWLR
jgi:tRNA(fMet)-specific endonuclease VapC